MAANTGTGKKVYPLDILQKVLDRLCRHRNEDGYVFMAPVELLKDGGDISFPSNPKTGKLTGRDFSFIYQALETLGIVKVYHYKSTEFSNHIAKVLKERVDPSVYAEHFKFESKAEREARLKVERLEAGLKKAREELLSLQPEGQESSKKPVEDLANPPEGIA